MIVSLLSLVAAPAYACSCDGTPALLPQADEVGVSVLARPSAQLYDDLDVAELTLEDGTPVPADVEVGDDMLLQLVPTAPLLPETTYLFSVQTASGELGTARFTTGVADAPSTELPQLVIAGSVTHDLRGEDGAACGPALYQLVDVGAAEAPLVELEVTRDGTTEALRVLPDFVFLGAPGLCSVPNAELEVGEVVELRARWLELDGAAGAWSAVHTATVEDGAGGADGATGCSSTGATPGAFGALLALAFASRRR